MADNTLSSAASILYEMRGPMQANYPKDNVLLAEWSGVGADNGAGRITPLENREAFSGSQVRIPVDLYMLNAAGWHSETGTVNAPVAADITEAHVTLKRITQPFSITLDLEEDSMDNSAIQGVAMLVKKAREGLANQVNIAMNGDGTGKLAAVTNGDSDGLVATVGTSADWDLLPVGLVCDVLVTTDGTDPGQGKRRKIASVDTTAGTVTFSTSQAASDGGSGNITLSTNGKGIYVAGSYGQIMAGGIEAAAAQTGTFQAISRSSFPTWKATDGRAGVSSTSPFSENMADAGQEIGLRSGANGRYDFGVGSPASIRIFKNGKLAQVRYQVPTGVLKSGFSGVQLDVGGQTITLVPERKHKAASIKLLRKDAASLYGKKSGPDFEDSTGAMWQRFARSWPKEAWLTDRLEWGWYDVSKILYFNNLAES